ncbi:probable cytochrome-c oxidase chain VIIc [Cephalotrichum gorgonifer]|uniref:Cytochrome c oxidase subunit 8, mitochondrial n=1 Tax=Cephalotrichum gorgonifer TaxID=2041049 RepID=A0AAE8N0P8_9PEZI|nr:probable cytochrome-c oxidase chain VIIc [Cephalotrichum gorgonifer]
MNARIASRAIARRGFHTSRAQFSSPYHYPEGPRSNIPFNPKSKWFPFAYWGFMATGFSLPFAISVWQTLKPRD